MESNLDTFLNSLSKSSIKGIADDSRKVKKGYIFVAIKGLTVDGHKFISQAVENGALYIVAEKRLDEGLPKGIKYLKVENSRKALSLIAAWYYNYPAKRLKMIGVTGTDGKTTTASIIYWILRIAGKKVGLISTVSAKIGNKEYDTGFHVTNPEPIELQKFLSLMVRKQCGYCVLEVTSHGLDQERVYGIDFKISVLTNITHEHLDYHKTFENYVKAKEKLFKRSKISVLNENYSNLIKNGGKKILYTSNSLSDSKVRKSILKKFKESYNHLNSTAAALVAKSLGINDSEIVRAIETFPGVVGRMEEVKNNRGVRIIIDFAHTPNALKNVLEALKKEVPKEKKLVCVFGCAGERDIQKRPMMGRISTDLADVSVFTSEDPRNEKVENIFSQMVKGIKNKKSRFYIEPDRAAAISLAINKLAEVGDVVVICGKGHERSMNYSGIEKPWLDKDAVMSALGNVSAIILAAGKGKRMGGNIPKVLLKINGKSILHHGLKKIKEIGIEDVVIVTGDNSDLIEKEIKRIKYQVKFARQGQKTGTGGATMYGLKAVDNNSDSVLIMFGDDSAFYKKETLKNFIKYYFLKKAPFVAAVVRENGILPVGGLATNSDGDILGVLTPDDLKEKGFNKTLVLCGLLCFNKNWLNEKIKLIPRTKKDGEYRLPHLFKVAYEEGRAAKPFFIKDRSEWASVNTPEDLRVARKKGMKRWKK